MLITQCSEGAIIVPGLGAFERQKLIDLVVSLDIVLMLMFVSYIFTMKWLLKRQKKEYDIANVTVDDFALQIQNLPPKEDYLEDETLLRAMIWKHLDTCIPQQQSISEQLGAKLDENVKPEEVAHIEFGYMDFAKYETLSEIHKLRE